MLLKGEIPLSLTHAVGRRRNLSAAGTVAGLTVKDNRHPTREQAQEMSTGPFLSYVTP